MDFTQRVAVNITMGAQMEESFDLSALLALYLAPVLAHAKRLKWPRNVSCKPSLSLCKSYCLSINNLIPSSKGHMHSSAHLKYGTLV